MEYAELQCCTNFSFLEGGSHAKELIERAVELGLKAIAITDRHGVYSIPRAYAAAKDHPSLKLITGARISIEGRTSISILACDRAGYGLLCRTLTAAHADQPKSEASLRWEEFTKIIDQPAGQGLIALPEDGEATDYESLKCLFDDRLYFPLARSLDGRDRERTKRAREISDRYGIPLLATNDVHYHHPSRRRLQDILTATRHGTTLEGAGTRLFSNAERYLKSPQEMSAIFSDLPDAVSRTLEIAERCSFSPKELKYRYPSEWIPAGETPQSHLEALVAKGADWRYGGDVPDAVRKQLAHELELVRQLSFADYFLTIWEIVDFAKSKKILCQGRGSAANSVICYCLGITAIDPVKMKLLFERFISVERGEPPDIDVDFEHERREEVIQHMYEKYGRHRAAMVSAVVTYRSRLAAREVKKALGWPMNERREDAWESLPPELKPLAEPARELADELYGFPRHLSIHSGGFTLSADPIIETVPVEPARMEGRTIIQWDKYDLDTLGLLKVDVLSLGMLTALRKCMDLVNVSPGIPPNVGKTLNPEPRPLTLATIPPDDAATYRMIQIADTVGVFQIESRAQMSMLPRLLPAQFYDLVVQVAIVRPGPIVGKMVHPYLKRRKGLEAIDMPHPKLRSILERTLGVPIFQEQVMQMAIQLAGFTGGEADELRRAIGAWRSSGSIDKVGTRLKIGMLAEGVPQEFVDRVFEQIKGFAEYGFPESHAASFALLAYASSYLKCHYPAEFVCALINSLPMGFYSAHTLIDDAKRHGATVLPIDPNLSAWDCVMEGKSLRLGFCVVSGLPRASADALIRARGDRRFTSLHDFLARAPLRSDVLQRLAMGDAFQIFRQSQREALWSILAFTLLDTREKPGGQLNLFHSVQEQARDAPVSHEGYTQSPETVLQPLSLGQSIESEYRSFGLSIKGHPMQAVRAELRSRLSSARTKSRAHNPQRVIWLSLTSRLVRQLPRGRTVQVGGMTIVRQRPPTANGTMFATLEDEEGFFDLILHSETHERTRSIFREHAFLVIEGCVQRDGEAVSILVKTVRPISESLELSADFKIQSRDFR